MKGSVYTGPFVFWDYFWVLRTLRYQWQSRGQLRKYGR